MKSVRSAIVNIEQNEKNLGLRRAFNREVLLMGGQKLCLACGDMAEGGAPSANTEGEAKWVEVAGLNHAGPSRVPERETPEGATLEIQFKSNDAFWNHDGTFVWWAATPRPLSDAHMDPSPPPDAYNAAGTSPWPNSGKVRKSEDDTITIQLLAPQPYLEEGSLWPRHVHFMQSPDGNIVDPSSVFTVGAWPSHHEKDYKCHCISSSCEGVRSCSIVDPVEVKNVLQNGAHKENYWRINATGEKDKTLFECGNFIALSHEASEGEIRDAVKDIGTSPVVVYCANPTCNAASKLIRKLMHLGLCSNLFYMPAGYSGFR